MTKHLAGILVAILLGGCGGGGGAVDPPGSPPPSSSPPPPAPASGIGSAGGTVTGPNGSQVVVPAGALSTNTHIVIEQSAQNAPPLPAGVTPMGAIFAMTPHGTTFSVPAKVTLPFDSAALPAGTEPRIYKTNSATGEWELLVELERDAATTTAEVGSFSHFFVAPVPLPPLERGVAERSWIFEEFHADGLEPTVVEQEDGLPNSQTGGIASDEHDFGPLPLMVNGDDRATGAVYSSEKGTTYWVFAQGPQGSIQTPASRIGNRVTLIQKQGFRKNSADARLKLHVTRVFVEAIDANGAEILYPECPWTLDCNLVISGSVTFDVRAYHYATFFSGRSRVELSGHQGRWGARNQTVIDARQRLWDDDFVIDRDVGGNGSKQHARYALREPITIDIDLSKVQVGESFTLFIEAIAETMNRRQRESYVSAFFRDPLGIEGTSVETHGLEPVEVPFDDAPADERRAAECTTGVDAEAGVLQFESADFLAPEAPYGGGQIQVTRTGGSRGDVSATIRTADGAAIAGSDYEAIESSVFFGDGDTATRTLDVPIVLDQIAEPDKSLTIMLENPRGCAALGAIDNATLTILDDDRPEAPQATYTVGGTLSGLEGSGLLLREVVTGAELSPANGAFRFNADKPDGSRYEVRVARQPAQPLQVCTVANGQGLVAGANVDDVAVRCETPAPGGSLDPAFGHEGRVINAALGEGRALALQGDGKILALAAQGLARFEPDGTLDEAFGTNGIAGSSDSLFLGTIGDEPRDVAVQRDGRILVVGYTRTSAASTNYDFAIRRLLVDGTNDSGFGTDGLVTIDFNGEVDRALRVIVLPDDRILVGGHAGSRSTQNELRNSFAAALLTSAGALDRSFAGDGTVTSIGASSFAYGLAVDASGKILLGGSRAEEGAAEKDAALVRFHPDGTPDSNDDQDAEIWFGADGSGVGIDDLLGDDDSIQDLLVDEEGRIWSVVQSLSGGKYDFMFGQFSEHFGNVTGQGARFQQFVARMGPGNDLGQALARSPAGEFIVAGSASSTTAAYNFGIARFTAAGGLDTTFGDGGKVTFDFFGADDGANDVIVQPDGRIIATGAVRNGTSLQFGMVRVLP